jgi:hypothetical protein
MTIDDLYRELLDSRGRSEIREYLPVLRELGETHGYVVELGMRSGQSTVAFLACRPGAMWSVDLLKHENVVRIDEAIASHGLPETIWTFVEGDSRKVGPWECNLLFIDSTHTGKHLRQELERHEPTTRNTIVLHDTVSAWERGWYYRRKDLAGRFGEGVSVGDKGRKVWAPGLKSAVKWLTTERPWRIEKEYREGKGLMVLERT